MKYHIQTERSLRAIQFNDIRTTLQALIDLRQLQQPAHQRV
jgi:hypothetical protein